MVELMELPLESLELIVSKLPLKTILACKCVSKSLFDLISSFKNNPDFTTSLFSQNPNTHCHIIYQSSERPINFVYLIDAHLDLINPPSGALELSPFYTIPKFVGDELDDEIDELALVNSCNGLLFISSISTTKPSSFIFSIVCNPVTKEYVEIPEIFTGTPLSSSSIWLGFSPISRKYKVIFFTKKRFNGKLGALIHVVGSRRVRPIQSDDQSLDYNINWDSSYIFLNGTGYWLRQKNYQSDFIISFDFENEVLGKINPPPSFDEKCLDLMGIGAVGDCLCLVDNSGDNRLDIWMMTTNKGTGDWVKKFTHENKPPQLCGIMLGPLQEMSNGDIMMVSSDKQRIVFYDANRNRFRLIKFSLGSSVSTFVPSFVSLKHTLRGTHFQRGNRKAENRSIVG